MTGPFRFGVAVGLVPSGTALLDTAVRIERLGYSALVVADGLWLPAPLTMLSAAASVTSRLRLGTHVLAAPLRAPETVAQETETLDLVSGHRFELGLGTGHAGIADDAERVGRRFGTRPQRVALVAETIGAVRQRFAARDTEPPRVMLAGVGRDLVELAVDQADALALPVPFDRGEDDLAKEVGQLRTDAGAGVDDLELAVATLAVGDKEQPEWVPAAFRPPARSYARLGGEPAEIADTLRRRRDRLGISYVTVPQWSIDEFAPVVDLLAGT